MSYATDDAERSSACKEQIVRILKEVEAGARVAETGRKHGISEPTYYVWKNKYAGMEVSRLRHLKYVQAELARPKRMCADLALEHHALKDVLSRKL
ncbi:putative transposase [Luteibacter sp. Sphag1AF]|uniref:transposase n=1 Tax=Luteibacter sp. Sphag1AF TaxID=2587031 RepID=UPI00161B5DD7|nr:transposase [Luteibacter sp. Sphag1AF]MBB3229183.1 putative transposase [Luteibacter sp. Sphag1AF]